MTDNVIPSHVFADALERKRDPKGYEARKIHEAIDKQVKASEAAKPLLIGDVPEMDEGFDDQDIPIMDKPLCWGPDYDRTQMLLTRYFSERQRDPGDETDD